MHPSILETVRDILTATDDLAVYQAKLADLETQSRELTRDTQSTLDIIDELRTERTDAEERLLELLHDTYPKEA
jgi:chromosome segregation ATPase